MKINAKMITDNLLDIQLFSAQFSLQNFLHHPSKPEVILQANQAFSTFHQ